MVDKKAYFMYAVEHPIIPSWRVCSLGENTRNQLHLQDYTHHCLVLVVVVGGIMKIQETVWTG